MNGKDPQQNPDEAALVRMYMDLTGASEMDARCVFMFATPEREGEGTKTSKDAVQPSRKPAKAASGATVALGFFLACLWGVVLNAGAETAAATLPNAFASPLSLADAVNVALSQNPNVQRAQKDLEATAGVVLQTRAIVVPKLGVTGSFSAIQDTDIDRTPGLPFALANEKNWRTQVRLVQSIYEGGRMASALRSARLLKEQSVLSYQTVLADTVLAVEVGYYDVLLAEQQITVQQASVELLDRELADTTRRYEAGTVPRFNVLRAEVELANARPRLIRAQNSFRIAKNSLANLLGLTLPANNGQEIPLKLSGQLEAEPYSMDLSRAIRLALEQRTELGSLQKAETLRQEDVKAAKAGALPSLQGFVGYDVHNSMFDPDLTQEFHGWTAGVELTWNIFDGLQTRGKVSQARALHDRAVVDLEDARRQIELEVRTAYSNFVEAQEVLESQKKVLEQAEEALRLARARSEAGTGTQLDVLSAQTALTEARTTQVQALRDYDVARARLERAVGMKNPALAEQR